MRRAALVAVMVLSLLGMAAPASAAAHQVSPAHWLVKGQDMGYNGSPQSLASGVDSIGVTACAAGQAPCPAQSVTLPAPSWELCGTWNGKVYGQSDYTTCTGPPGTLVVEGENMLVHAVSDGLFTATGITTALLDIESWAYTPADEQANVPSTITTADAVARAAGVSLIVSPGGTFAHCTACWRAAAAGGAYMVAAQTQGGTSLATFEARVSLALATVHAARPATLVMAGVATNTPTVHPLALLQQEYAYVRSVGISNIWLNANNWQGSNLCPAADGGPGCPQIAVSFLASP